MTATPNTPRVPRRVPLDVLWYVVLVDKRPTGGGGQHWLLGIGTDAKTRDFSRAHSFPTEASARAWFEGKGYSLVPRGFRPFIEQIPRYERRARPRKVVVQTPYGPVKTAEDQPLLF